MSVPAVSATTSIIDPHDLSQERLDNFVRDGASSQYNRFGDMGDTTSGRTYIKRAKRVDSNDLPLDLGVQGSEPYFKGNIYDSFGSPAEQQELLSDGLFDKPESFIPAFESNKTDF